MLTVLEAGRTSKEGGMDRELSWERKLPPLIVFHWWWPQLLSCSYNLLVPPSSRSIYTCQLRAPPKNWPGPCRDLSTSPEALIAVLSRMYIRTALIHWGSVTATATQWFRTASSPSCWMFDSGLSGDPRLLSIWGWFRSLWSKVRMWANSLPKSSYSSCRLQTLTVKVVLGQSLHPHPWLCHRCWWETLVFSVRTYPSEPSLHQTREWKKKKEGKGPNAVKQD